MLILNNRALDDIAFQTNKIHSYRKTFAFSGAKFSSFRVVPYFFGYKTEFFSFKNNPKDLDPSCKMDLDLWDCLGRVKLVL